MTLKADKQSDGTYVIWDTDGGREILLTGVRGCNVNCTISRLYREELFTTEDE
jgi:hypothetical protein